MYSDQDDVDIENGNVEDDGQRKDALTGFRVEELDNVSGDIEGVEGENLNLEGFDLDGNELPVKKVAKKLWKYDHSKMLEEDNGMKMLF